MLARETQLIFVAATCVHFLWESQQKWLNRNWISQLWQTEMRHTEFLSNLNFGRADSSALRSDLGLATARDLGSESLGAAIILWLEQPCSKWSTKSCPRSALNLPLEFDIQEGIHRECRMSFSLSSFMCCCFFTMNPNQLSPLLTLVSYAKFLIFPTLRVTSSMPLCMDQIFFSRNGTSVSTTFATKNLFLLHLWWHAPRICAQRYWFSLPRTRLPSSNLLFSRTPIEREAMVYWGKALLV